VLKTGTTSSPSHERATAPPWWQSRKSSLILFGFSYFTVNETPSDRLGLRIMHQLVLHWRYTNRKRFTHIYNIWTRNNGHCMQRPLNRGDALLKAPVKQSFHSTSIYFKRNHCPHSILGVSKQASLAEVKRSFIQLALEHHPDRAEANGSAPSQSSPDRFIQIRQAFEELIGKSNNSSHRQRTSTPKGWSPDELQDWWKSQDEAATKDFLTFEMSDATRQEVIQVYRTMSAGGKDKGGYWEMARQLAEREAVAESIGQTGDKGEPTRLLSASDNGLSTQRRRRNR
jgi:hypothetical protein